jgi:hypothetical protein
LIESSATGAVDASASRPVAFSWLLGGLIVTAFGVTLTLFSPLFGYAHEVGDMPIAWLVAGLVLAGFVYFLCLPQLISHSLSCDARESHLILVCIVAAGLAARLALFASEPILEDDYQRYLFDGAVTATGNNPYAMSPKDAPADGSGALGPLTREGATVVPSGRRSIGGIPSSSKSYSIRHIWKRLCFLSCSWRFCSPYEAGTSPPPRRLRPP